MRDVFFARNRNHEIFIFGTREPIFWRNRDIPHVTGHFELDSDMVEGAVSLGTSHPNDARWNNSRRPPGIPLTDLKHDGRIRGRIADTLILAAVAIDHNRL